MLSFLLGFRHYAGPYHQAGLWRAWGPMAATSPRMDAGTKGPFKRQALPTPALFFTVLLKRLVLASSSSSSLYFSFFLSSPSPFISIKLPPKFCLHGMSVPHSPWALTYRVASWPAKASLQPFTTISDLQSLSLSVCAQW